MTETVPITFVIQNVQGLMKVPEYRLAPIKIFDFIMAMVAVIILIAVIWDWFF